MNFPIGTVFGHNYFKKLRFVTKITSRVQPYGESAYGRIRNFTGTTVTYDLGCFDITILHIPDATKLERLIYDIPREM
jgi:hypothetical protein